MRRVLLMIASMFGAFVLFVILNNASFLAPVPQERGRLQAHRGVHQTFTSEGLTDESCTATMIYPPEHEYLENTIASMAEAFAHGADEVEIDIHPTTDGQFAVFHDWTVDCRTEGQGVTRELSMAYLKTLDIGYGYTADGGKTFPFRGKGVGLMPTLDEVLEKFPGKNFSLNIKSNDAEEARLLAARLSLLTPAERARISIFAADRPYAELRKQFPDMKMANRNMGQRCILDYITWGWMGRVPDTCRGGDFMVPRNYAWMMWGYPNRLYARMKNAGVSVFVIQPYHGGVYDPAIDDPAELQNVPPGFGIMTNKIEIMGPAWRRAR